MKMQIKNRVLAALLGALAVFSLPVASHAAAVTFGAATTIAADTDVSTSGTLLYAYDWANSAQTVNTVTFVGTTATNTVGANLTLSVFSGNNSSAFTSATAPFSGLSTAYKAILVGADYTSGATAATVTLNGLTVGHSYLVQLWVNDPRSGATSTRTETVTSGGGNTVTLAYCVTTVAGNPGQYTVGTFTADATTQVVTLTGNASTQINALQVRDTSTLTAYYWDENGNTAGIGSIDNLGTWDTSSSFWTTDVTGSSGSTTYPNASGLTTVANFAGTAGTVTIPTATAISAGSITFGTTAYTIAGADNTATLNASGVGALAVTTGTGNSETISAVIAGTAGLAKANDTGTLTLSATNTYTGITVINGGTLTIGGAGQLNSGSYAANIYNYGAFTYGSSAPQTLTGVISGTGTMTINSGTVVLGGGNINTYSGVTTINGGTLQLGQSGAFGNLGSGSTSIVVNSGGTLDFYQGETLGQVISGAGNVSTVSGLPSGSTETLTATNTYTGNTTIGSVVLKIGTAGQLGSGNYAGYITNNGQFLYSSSVAQTLSGVMSGTGNLTQSGSGALTVSGVISGSVSVTQNGPGVLTLSGTNTSSGTTTVSTGTLLVNGSIGTNTVTVAAGAILGGNGTINGPVSLTAGSFISPGNNAIGTLTLSNNSASSLVLNGNNTIRSKLSNVAGTSDLIAISGASGALVLNGANLISLSFPNGLAPIGTYTLMTYASKTGTGTLALDHVYPNAALTVGATSVTLSVTGAAAGGGYLVWRGDGSANAWNTTATGDWTNGVTSATYADAQIVVFNDSSTNPAVTITPNAVAPASMLVDTSLKAYTISGVVGIIGTNTLTKAGTATLTLSSSNNYSGTTIVNGGTLKLGTNTAFGASATVNSGGTLDLNGKDFTATMFNKPVNIAGAGSGGTAIANSSATRAQLQDVVLNNNATIAGANQIFIGGTNAVNGVLALGANTLTVGGSSSVMLNGLSVSGSGNINITNTATVYLSDNYTGGNQQNVNLTNNGSINIYSGASMICQKYGGGWTVATPIALNGGTFGSVWPSPNGLTISSPIVVNNNSTLNFNGAGYGNGTLSGNITGSGGLTVTGDSLARIFTGNNTYAGYTLISGGIMQIGNGATGTLGLGPVTNNATLTFNRTGTLVVSNQIAGTGPLNQNGTGTVTLFGTNSYTGATTVNAGTLALSGTASLTGTPSVTVNVGTLALSGAASIPNAPIITAAAGTLLDVSGLASAFTLGAAQTLTAGNAGTAITNINGNYTSNGTNVIAGIGTVGTLTVNGSLALTGSGVLNYDLNGPASSDLIAMTGASPALSLGGTTTITPAGAVSDGTYTLISGFTSVPFGGVGNLALAAIATNNTRSTPTASFAQNASTITLTISGSTASAANLVWQGNVNTNWDLSTLNWLNSVTPDKFYSLDNVTFDDTGISSTVALVGTLSPGSVTVSSSGINYNFGGAGSLSGGASLTMSGGSILTISNANTFGGGTTIGAGTLRLANANALGNGPLTMTGGILDLNSNNVSVQTLSGPAGTLITNMYVTATANNLTLTVNQVSSNGFAGLIQNGTGLTTNYIALVKNGPGYLQLSGASTYGKAGSGATVNAGTLEATAKAATGNYQGDYVVAQGATLKLGYNTTTSFNYGNGVTVNGISASDPSGLYLLGGKSLGFGDGITFQTAPSTVRAYGSGTTTILGGDVNNTHLTLNAAASGSVIASAVNISGTSYGYRMNIASGANTANGDLLIGGVISGGPGNAYAQNGQSAHVQKEGAGSLLLTNASTYTDGFWVKNGTLMLAGGNNRLPAGAGIVLGDGGANSGVLQLNGVGQTFTNIVTYGTGTANAVVGGSATASALTINNAFADTYAGILGGAGANQNNLALTKTGVGQLVLSGRLTYTGSTTISAGTVVAGSLTNADGATLSVPDVAGTLAATNLALGTSAGSTVAITGFAGAASAPIIVTNLSTAGTVTVSLSGTLTTGVAYPLIKYTSGTIGGAGFGAFTLLRGTSGVLSNDVANSQVDVILSGTQVYPLVWKGNVSTNWDVATTTNWAFGALASTYLNSDNVQLDDTATTASTNITLSASVTPSAFTVTNNTLNYTISGSGALAGSIGLTKNGAASLALLTTNTYTGVTTINGGTVSIATITNGGVASPLGAASNNTNNIVLNGGTLAYTGQTNSTDRGMIFTTNGATITVSQSTGNLTLNGAANSLTGAGSLTKNGNGTLTLSPITSGGYSMNNYTGGTVVNGGRLICTVWDWSTGRGIGSGLLTVNSGAFAEFTQVHGFGQDNGGKSAVINGGILQLDNTDYVTALTMTGGTVQGAGSMTTSSTGYGLVINANPASTTAVVSNNIYYTSGTGLQLNVSNGPAATSLALYGNITGAMPLVVNGAGTTLLTGANTYSGNTTINGGALVLTGSAFSPNTPVITLTNNSTLNVSNLASPLVLGGGQTLQGSGNVRGAVSDTGGTIITPGGLAKAGGLAFSSDLTLAGYDTLNFDLGKTPTSAGGAGITNNDQMTVVGNLTINPGTTININPIQVALAGGTYKLITYSGTLTDNSGGIDTAWTKTGYTPTGRVTGIALDASTPGEIDLIVTGSPANLVWSGDGGVNAWDISSPNDWLNGGVPDLFYQLDNVQFDDTSANPNVDIQYPVTPSSMVVSNGLNHYTFNSTVSQSISGGGTLTKTGSGTLTILNSNPYTGASTINQGILQIGDGTTDGALTGSPIVNNAELEFSVSPSGQTAATAISGTGQVVKDGAGTLQLASGANSWTGGLNILNGTAKPQAGVNNALPAGESVTVASGAAYDFNGVNNGSTTTRGYSFTIAGAGPDTVSGALVNNGASVQSYASVSNLTLSADATVGGSGRWDIGPVTNSTVNGNGHVLTKAGGNDLDIRAQNITNVAGIHITSGNMYYENFSQTNSGAGSTANMTNILESGAKLGIYGSQTINVPIVANGGTIDNQGSGVPVFSGPVDVEQPTIFDSTHGSIVFAGTITTNPASGSISLTGNNIVSFAGLDTVPVASMSWSSGTVQLGNNTPSGSVPDASIYVPSGATFSLNRSDLYTLTNVIYGDGNMSVLGTTGQVVNGSASINIAGNLSVGQGAYGKLLIQPGASIIANNIYMGNPASSVGGDVVQTGGTLTITNTTANSYPFRIGHWATETSTYSMFGGTNIVNGSLYVGYAGTGILRQTNGTIIVGSQLNINGVGSSYALEGGSIIIGGSGIVNNFSMYLGGGTVGASTNWSSSSAMTLSGTNGSVTFDTSVYTNTLSGVLSGPGGLVKASGGTLILSSSGTYTYAGDTIINGGVLTLSGSAVAGGVNKLTSGTVWVNPGATLNLAAAGEFNYGAGTPTVVLNAGTLAMTDSQYNYIKNITMTNGALWALGTGASVNGLTGANFNLSNVTSQASANTSTITSRGGALAVNNPGGITFNVGRGTAASDLTVSAALTDYNGIRGSLTKTGNGILTLNAANTYTSNTIVNGGTLAVGATGSIGNTTNVLIAGGATLDVSAAGLTLSSSQTLGNSSSTAVLNGNVNASLGTLALGFASGTPALNVTNGALTLAPTSTLKVNNTGAPLAIGSYKLVSKATAGNVGSVTGTVPSAFALGGNGMVGGATNSLQITAGELYLVVTATVNTSPTNIVSTVSGNTLTLSWPADHTGWKLQVQTNTLATGLGTNWFDWPNSTTTNAVSVTLDPNAPTVFFRMVY